MKPIFNFSAGPAVLPGEVLQQANDELTDWRGSGMSVMEMSHRGPEFTLIAAEAEADLRELLSIPEDYSVLFLQGGATAQFAMIPINLLRGAASADYVVTGEWSKKAVKEAGRFCSANIAATDAENGFRDIPPVSAWKTSADAAYLHYTVNETIGGVEFDWIPDTGNVPLVADMSSTILSRPLDVSRYGLIYAGAQKNIGPAGLTLVIVRNDLLGNAMPNMPAMYDYKLHADNGSMLNTPPTFAWYMAGLVFKWLKSRGGLQAMAEVNRRKAEKLYDYIDSTDGFYTNPVARTCRSWMNIPFTLKDAALDKPFLNGADESGLLQLKGHRSVGGMRASIYNAMPEAGVDALIGYMQQFMKENG